MLTLLSDTEGHPMSEIADFALVPSPTLTRIIDGMVADNLAYRRIDNLDRRRVLVFATRRGHVLYQQLQHVVERHEQQICGGVDLRSLTELLAQLIANTGLPEDGAASAPRRETDPSRHPDDMWCQKESGS